MAYLFRDDQPPSMIAMTLMDAKAKIITRPTLMFRAARFSLKGMVARLINAGAMIRMGATRNNVRSTPGGTSNCFESSLIASAMG